MVPGGGGGVHMFMWGSRGDAAKKRPSIAMYRRLLRFVGPYRWNLALAAALLVGLVRKARAEADPTKRAELYKQVSKIARTNVLRVPLLFADRPNAATARLVGYTGIEYFGTVWLRP